MSRMATKEYIGAKRRAYALADRAKRMRILDEACETTGYERKYANRLLTGSRKFREHRGRGAIYTPKDRVFLLRIWRKVGCPCTTYLRANIDEWVQEHRECVANIPDNIAAHLKSMSASTMDRMLKGRPTHKTGIHAKKSQVRTQQRTAQSNRLQIGRTCKGV